MLISSPQPTPTPRNIIKLQSANFKAPLTEDRAYTKAFVGMKANTALDSFQGGTFRTSLPQVSMKKNENNTLNPIGEQCNSFIFSDIRKDDTLLMRNDIIFDDHWSSKTPMNLKLKPSQLPNDGLKNSSMSKISKLSSSTNLNFVNPKVEIEHISGEDVQGDNLKSWEEANKNINRISYEGSQDYCSGSKNFVFADNISKNTVEFIHSNP